MENGLRLEDAKKIFADTFPKLRVLSKSNSQKEFNDLLAQVLPHIELYIKIELGRAVANGTLAEGRYNVNDFVDELYISAYEHLQEVSEDLNLLNWLFQRTDRLINEAVIEEEFDHAFIQNIDEIAALESNEMNEVLTIDANGEPVLVDELDESPYPIHNYELKDVFVEDNQQSLIDRLSNEMTNEQIKHHIENIVRRFPKSFRTIFDLSQNYNMSVQDISDIKQISTLEIGKILKQINRSIQISFERKITIS